MLQLRATDLEWVDTGTEIIVLDGDRDMYMAGNASTKALWPLLAAGTTLSGLAQRLTEQFGVGPDVARVDAEALVERLREKGLLNRA